MFVYDRFRKKINRRKIIKRNVEYNNWKVFGINLFLFLYLKTFHEKTFIRNKWMKKKKTNFFLFFFDTRVSFKTLRARRRPVTRRRRRCGQHTNAEKFRDSTFFPASAAVFTGIIRNTSISQRGLTLLDRDRRKRNRNRLTGCYNTRKYT